jgi:hypothetical protein
VIFGIFDNWAQVLEVLGVWLGATATFVAAYVALNVANRSNVQNVKVIAKPMVDIERGVRGGMIDVFYLSATNIGLRPVTLTHLAVKGSFPRFEGMLSEGLPGGSGIPVTIADGETAAWRYPEAATNGESWYKQFADRIRKRNRFVRWLFVKNLRFFVVTSLGQTFFAPVSKEFQKKVLEQLKG